MLKFGRTVADALSSKFQQVLRIAFVTAATPLNGGQPNFARCLAVFWAGTLLIHFRWICSVTDFFPGAKFTLRPSLAFPYIGIVTARHSSNGRQPNCGVQQRAPHLYSAERRSRWASAHILVVGNFMFSLVFIFIYFLLFSLYRKW